MDENKQIIEINGVKLEVDLRHAKRIDHFCIGDRIKVLKKKYETHYVYPGIIVGFENFKELPTIVIAYLNTDYSSETNLSFAYFNAESKDIDIVVTDDSYLPIEKASVIDDFDREIVKKEAELQDMLRKKTYFLKHFNRYFEFEGE